MDTVSKTLQGSTHFYCCKPGSSSDRVEQWGGREKTARRTGSRSQPVALPTTFLTHPQFSLTFALDPSGQATLEKLQETKAVALKCGEHKGHLGNKCDLAAPQGPWWAAASVTDWWLCNCLCMKSWSCSPDRSCCCRFLQLVTWSKGVAGPRQCSYQHMHAAFQGTDKTEQLSHTFVFVQRRQFHGKRSCQVTRGKFFQDACENNRVLTVIPKATDLILHAKTLFAWSTNQFYFSFDGRVCSYNTPDILK